MRVYKFLGEIVHAGRSEVDGIRVGGSDIGKFKGECP